ncbi:gamma-butyrobetaine hydroxylase-like domain-containing protein [Polynucleobacter sp. CS-Odin-A6]|uniref:gamma-butyrobetaine hydroxylase-like domain-containing protein n=1 Tax=Polynucleobacter sp. CS-Odin-A6 TaxID=2689106 RepID=UPI001C0CAC03|nr:DUF971 domain-containing protein [Polynucleobacter sp. CS-Odin-A6]MBU3620156.1 DUF971 domain-containing protein [Polynucleobacter sp. CS-Odin-A6]
MIPTNILVHQQSKVLELSYSNGNTYRLPFEFLRVVSPSAEVQGHGPGQETLQTGKREVLIANLEQVGRYALKPSFSDGHDSGLYTWDFLYFLCENHEQLWQEHLDKLAAAGLERDAPMNAAGGQSCGSH